MKKILKNEKTKIVRVKMKNKKRNLLKYSINKSFNHNSKNIRERVSSNLLIFDYLKKLKKNIKIDLSNHNLDDSRKSRINKNKKKKMNNNTNNNHKYKKLSALVDNLRKENEFLKLKFNNFINQDNDGINKSPIIENATPFNLSNLKDKYSWSDNYYKFNEKLYKQLYIFFIDKYPKIKNKDISIEEKNVFNLLKDPNEVEKFIYYRFNKNAVSFANRVNKVTRLVQKVIGDDNFKLININIKENKNMNNKEISEDEISLIFQELDHCNSKAIYIIFILLIIYGFSLRLISKMKRKNFHPIKYMIDINYNKNRKRKKISPLVCQYILSYAFDSKITERDFLFFNDYKNVDSLPREKYIIWRVNDELNNIYSINNERLRIINSYFHSIRSSLKINESFYFSKNFFIMEP